MSFKSELSLLSTSGRIKLAMNERRRLSAMQRRQLFLRISFDMGLILMQTCAIFLFLQFLSSPYSKGLEYQLLFLYSVILTEYVAIEPRVCVCVCVCVCTHVHFSIHTYSRLSSSQYTSKVSWGWLDTCTDVSEHVLIGSPQAMVMWPQWTPNKAAPIRLFTSSFRAYFKHIMVYVLKLSYVLTDRIHITMIVWDILTF